MPLGLALRLVDEAAVLGVFSSVGLTGGEPMLFFDDLLQIGDRCKRGGIPFTVVTSGNWATSQEEADRRVSMLAARGLSRLSVSHDPSHARFVPRERVLNAVRAARSAGITTQVVGAFDSDGLDLAQYAPELAAIPDIRLATTKIARVGRGSSRPERNDGGSGRSSSSPLLCSRPWYLDLVVFYDGEVWPCCSTFNLATPSLSIGNAHREGLKTLWQRANGSLMLRVMKREGFERLYEIVHDLDPETWAKLPTRIGDEDACSFCHRIFGNIPLASSLKAIFRVYERDRTLEAVDALTETIGCEATARLLEAFVTPGDSRPVRRPGT